MQVTESFPFLKYHPAACWAPKDSNGFACLLGTCKVKMPNAEIYFHNGAHMAVLTYLLLQSTKIDDTTTTWSCSSFSETIEITTSFAKPLFSREALRNSDANAKDCKSKQTAECNPRVWQLGILLAANKKIVKSNLEITVPYYESKDLRYKCDCTGVTANCVCNTKPTTDPENPPTKNSQTDLCEFLDQTKSELTCDLTNYNPASETDSRKIIRVKVSNSTGATLGHKNYILNVLQASDSHLSTPGTPSPADWGTLDSALDPAAVGSINFVWRYFSELPEGFVNNQISPPKSQYLSNLGFQITSAAELKVYSGNLIAWMNLGYFNATIESEKENSVILAIMGYEGRNELKLALRKTDIGSMPHICAVLTHNNLKTPMMFDTMCLHGNDYGSYASTDSVNPNVLVLKFGRDDNGVAAVAGFRFLATDPNQSQIREFVRGVYDANGKVRLEVSSLHNGAIVFQKEKYILEISFDNQAGESDNLVLKGHCSSGNSVTFIRQISHGEYRKRFNKRHVYDSTDYIVPRYATPLRTDPVKLSMPNEYNLDETLTFDTSELDNPHNERLALVSESPREASSTTKTNLYVSYYSRIDGEITQEDYPIRINHQSGKNSNPDSTIMRLWPYTVLLPASSVFAKILYSDKDHINDFTNIASKP
jgi:hypothetical protein